MRQDCFPTPIWNFQYADAQNLNQQILQEIERERERDHQGINVSNVLGWHSKDNLHLKQPFQEFVSISTNAVLEAGREIAWDFRLAKPTFNNCWAVINDKFASNSLHHHPNSILSGVYYVRAPENSGNIYFQDPRSGSRMLQPPFAQMTPWTLAKITYKAIASFSDLRRKRSRH